jgi:formate/nitrite transporter FocA (FNT family)
VLGGLGLALSPVLSDDVAAAALHLAEHQVGHGFAAAFAKAVVAGWLVAGMTWIVHGVRNSTARLLVIWIFFYAVGAFDLVHCVAGTAEAAYAWWAGSVTLWSALVSFLLPAVLGNTVGGVVLVALLNFAQARDRWFRTAQLSWRDMLWSLQTAGEPHPLQEAHDQASAAD